MSAAACAKRIIDGAVSAVALSTAEVIKDDPGAFSVETLDNFRMIDTLYLDLTALAHDGEEGLPDLLKKFLATTLDVRREQLE